jgi:hypothetical protein
MKEILLLKGRGKITSPNLEVLAVRYFLLPCLIRLVFDR